MVQRYQFHDPAIERIARVAEALEATMAIPTVTQCQPNAGKATAGTFVVITGTNFTGTTAVHFGPNVATGVTVVSATQITCTAPSGTGTVDITVTNGSGTSTANPPGDQYTFTMPVPSDPSATSAAVSLFDFLYNLTFQQSGFTSGGNGLHLIGQILSGQDEFNAALNGGDPNGSFDQWKRTTGKTPSFKQIAVDFCNDVNALASYTGQGVAKVAWGAHLSALVPHALAGGILGIQNGLRNIPTQYVANGTTGGSTTVGAINTAGTLNLNTATGWTDLPGGGGQFKLTVQTSPNPTLAQGTYTSRTGTGTITLNGVNIPLVGGVSGSIVVNAAAVCYEAQLLPSKQNFLTAAETAGAYPLQYSSTAYQKLTGGGGAGPGTLGCSWTGITNSITVPVGTTKTMPVVKGMYITGDPALQSGTTVSSINVAGTTITLSKNTTGSPAGGGGSTSTLSFTLGQSTDYAAALLEDANANLNAMLDQLIPGFAFLAALGIPVVFRHLNEANANGANWYHWTGSGNCYWWEYLFAYCWGYLTGNQVFSGQPVSSTPVHNLLFVHAPLADTAANAILHPPTINGKVYCDIIGIDEYANPPSSFSTNVVTGIATLTGMGGLPRFYAELFGGNVSNGFPIGFLDAGTYGSGTVDLSTLSGSSLVVDQAPDLPNIYQPTYNPFSGSAGSTLLVPTTKGLYSVTYQTVTNSGNPGCTFGTLGVSGVPAGAYLISKGCVAQPVAIPANNCGTSSFLSPVHARQSGFMMWWGPFDQLYADLAGATTIITDSQVINLEGLPTYYTPPWKGGFDALLGMMG